jgi:hypothetical protein
LIQWKLVERGQDAPPDALAIGHETDGQLLYAARAWFNGGVHLGKWVFFAPRVGSSEEKKELTR